MKNSYKLSTLIACFCALTIFANPQVKTDSLNCLEIEGKILNAAEQPGSPCKIELWEASGVVDTITLKPGKTKFTFVLKRNTYYTIRIIKNGFVDKLVCVNTEMPLEDDVLFRFRFNTSLMETAVTKNMNHDALDFPVAIIHYQEEVEGFNYNESYTRRIKQDLYINTPTTIANNKR